METALLGILFYEIFRHFGIVESIFYRNCTLWHVFSFQKEKNLLK